MYGGKANADVFGIQPLWANAPAPARASIEDAVALVRRRAVVIVQDYGVAALAGRVPLRRDEGPEETAVHHLLPPEPLVVPRAKHVTHLHASNGAEPLTTPAAVGQAPALINGDSARLRRHRLVHAGRVRWRWQASRPP